MAETGGETAGEEAGVEGAEEFNTFNQGIAGGDDLPVETAERDAGTDVQMAAAVLRGGPAATTEGAWPCAPRHRHVCRRTLCGRDEC